MTLARNPYGQREMYSSRRHLGLRSRAHCRFHDRLGGGSVPIWEVSTAQLTRLVDWYDKLYATDTAFKSALEMVRIGCSYVPQAKRPHRSIHSRPMDAQSFAPYTLMANARFYYLVAEKFRRELRYRRNREYRAFINQLIHAPESNPTTYRIFADWLGDASMYIEERRVRRFITLVRI